MMPTRKKQANGRPGGPWQYLNRGDRFVHGKRWGMLLTWLFCVLLGLLIGLWWRSGHPLPGALPFVKGSASSPPEPAPSPVAASATSATPDPVAATPPPPPPPAPRPSFALSSTRVQQGTFVMLHMQGMVAPDGLTVTGLNDHGLWIPDHGGWTMLLAVADNAKPGGAMVRVTWSGGTWEQPITIEHFPFTEDRITVSKQQGDSVSDPQVERDGELLNRTRSHPAATPLWHDTFLWPVQGPITTQFGEIRYINDIPTGQHTGIDIGVAAGTPIHATNRGTVVIATNMVLTGNTVVIDHGAGLFSLYAHMSRMDVAVGQTVERGDVIGGVGSTGLSTGPHLHWTMTIGNTFVDPLLFADKPLLPDAGQASAQ